MPSLTSVSTASMTFFQSASVPLPSPMMRAWYWAFLSSLTRCLSRWRISSISESNWPIRSCRSFHWVGSAGSSSRMKRAMKICSSVAACRRRWNMLFWSESGLPSTISTAIRRADWASAVRSIAFSRKPRYFSPFSITCRRRATAIAAASKQPATSSHWRGSLGIGALEWFIHRKQSSRALALLMISRSRGSISV